MESIRDCNGQIEYFIDRESSCTTVRDKNGQIIGWVCNGNTYKANGQLVSYSENIAALFR